MSNKKVENLLTCMGFTNKDGVYSKQYTVHCCAISVDTDSKSIIYPDEMTLGDKTTSNFSHEENFVVLECVNRLLEKGYSPSSIELEKKWPLGKNSRAGKLDILVKQQDTNTPYIMIECKTFGREFEAEADNMVTMGKGKGGGQLFSYWHQDRAAEYLCLYSSRPIESGEVEFRNYIIKIDDGIRNSSSTKSAHERWNKQFLHSGIFDDDAQPYHVATKPLVRSDIKKLQKKDGNLIYLQFLEILRHNVVSDKGNAFNKIFNLFLCKIVDEDRDESEELKFQWIEGLDDAESLIGRLNDLFKHGMARYLNKAVTDYNLDDLNLKKLDSEIAKIITELRLYKNQEFAFVEVYNRESFEENSRIVIEMVKLLQGWQLKYTHKQQFLGDFFESLLNTGFKQESGQFFTPVPLVRFIVQSLPVNKIIEAKVDAREPDFLPTIIDFACGSGHFLTESMDVVQEAIMRLNKNRMTPAQRDRHKSYMADHFAWARDFIYGIEKDYRLAKTSKLSSFLNGDGEACVIHGSGIDPFSSDSYVGRLRAKNRNANENPVFDMLVANPPYAVKGFKATVKDGSERFSLFDTLTDKSDEIEVLFVERMVQLVKPGGVAGIILPRSFLIGDGSYQEARKMILENFFIKGLVTLGSKAFLSTGINTVIFMLKKRPTSITLNKSKIKNICSEKIVFVDTERGGSNEEKRFLGYECSSRKGSEGIKVRSEFFLFDDSDLMSTKYVNSYIYRAMLDEPVPAPSARLRNNVKVMKLGDVLDVEPSSDTPFAINVNFYKLHHDEVDLVPLIDHIETPIAGRRPKGGVSEIVNGVLSLGGEHIDEEMGTLSLEKKKFVSQEFYDESQRSHVRCGDILVCKDGARTGKSAYCRDLPTECCVNEHLFIIRARQETISQDFLFYFMFSTFFRKQVDKWAGGKKGQAGLNQKHFTKILIPFFGMDAQSMIVKVIDRKWSSTSGKGAKKKLVNQVLRDKGVYETDWNSG